MKKNIILISAFIVILGSQLVFSEPGSDKDPLVSKSYVDSKIEELKAYIDTKGTTGGSSDKLEVVNVEAGSYLIGNQGTEIILRGGKATAHGVKVDGGIVDVTQGVDIDLNESQLPYNHQLIIPRNDGRGAYAKTDAVFMVRGSYKITK